MDIIHLLPDSVANQIAAGEVIQRPASVVKELVENALDAGATRVEVNIIDAGRTSIQVVDNGRGMSETDARMAFERHATSKILSADDLFALTTFGFRGEALPSIASVAQVTLTTCTADAELGTRLRIEGSRVVDQQPEACPPGANFVVQNLFYNVPARRKFLKTDQTELSNITTEMERIVLVHPEVAFVLTSNGATLMNLPVATQKQRIAAVYGQRLADRLLPVEVETPLVSISGFVAQPEAARKRGAQQFFFVDGRYMRHPYFHRAVQEAFANLIAPDTSVPYFISMKVDPSEIDINIHPTKTEIKFENEQAIWQILLAALRETLGRLGAVPTIDFDTEGRPADIPVYMPTASAGNSANAHTTHQAPPSIPIDSSYDPFAGIDVGAKPFGTQQSGLELPLHAATNSIATMQLAGRYIAVPDADGGLMLVDQHRAHTRVLYNKYVQASVQMPLPSQRLLFPDVADIAPSDAPIVDSLLPELATLGFDVARLSPTSVSISGITAGLEGIDPARLLTELISAARATDAAHAGNTLRSRLALALARSAAIPVGQALSGLEMNDLIQQLLATESPAITPDGRVVSVNISTSDIDKMFA